MRVSSGGFIRGGHHGLDSDVMLQPVTDRHLGEVTWRRSIEVTYRLTTGMGEFQPEGERVHLRRIVSLDDRNPQQAVLGSDSHSSDAASQSVCSAANTSRAISSISVT